jgi:hypothetical protein
LELASQLGAFTVSAMPDEQSGEVGGFQNTVTDLGAYGIPFIFDSCHR